MTTWWSTCAGSSLASTMKRALRNSLTLRSWIGACKPWAITQHHFFGCQGMRNGGSHGFADEGAYPAQHYRGSRWSRMQVLLLNLINFLSLKIPGSSNQTTAQIDCPNASKKFSQKSGTTQELDLTYCPHLAWVPFQLAPLLIAAFTAMPVSKPNKERMGLLKART